MTSERVNMETHNLPDSSHNYRDDLIYDPLKLSRPKKLYVFVTGLFCTFNTSLGTSLPSGAFEAISEQFNTSNKVKLTLLNSLYMAGFVLGPLLFGPLSESIGRRPVIITSYCGYVTFLLACSGAPNFNTLLVFRLLCGVSAAAPTTVIAGLYADILENPIHRGSAVAFFIAVNTLGSLTGPLVSGFVSQVSWRWPFWTAGLMAGPGILLTILMPETFGPVLNHKQTRQHLSTNTVPHGNFETQFRSFDVRQIFLRPVKLMITEPILLLSSLYLALAYAILYLMFQAYPIVYQGMYGLSPGMATLAYLPVMVGVIFALCIFFGFTWWYDHAANMNKPWAQREIYRRLPIACFGAPCMVVSLFWFGWMSRDTISPIVASIGGLFLGLGFHLIFLSMLNYITDIFRQMSASAHAGASCLRSIGAVVIPLAADSLYTRLGIHWAPSLLGFLSLFLGLVPFVFIRYGETWARKSNFADDLYRIA